MTMQTDVLTNHAECGRNRIASVHTEKGELMSLILEGVDLPKGDEKLKIEIEPDGTVWVDQGSEWEKHEGGAVQILRPHGRLGDLGKVLNGLEADTREAFTKHDVWLLLSKYNAPTILKEEE